jgi:hypothetical protein
MDNVMITSTIFGIVLSVLSPNDTAVDPASMVFKGLMTANKIHEMKENDQLDASLHEEGHQMMKDFIREVGK